MRLAEGPGRTLVGLDVDLAVCRMAVLGPEPHPGGIVCYGGGPFPFDDNCFSGAYAHEVIEHVECLGDFLSEVFRILRPGGFFLLTTPNAAKEPLDPVKHAAHVRHFRYEELSGLLAEHGFRVQQLYWRMHPLCSLIDDSIASLGRSLVLGQQLQPGMLDWSADAQAWHVRFLVDTYRLLEPVLRAVLLAEYRVLRKSVPGRNLILMTQTIAPENGNLNGAR